MIFFKKTIEERPVDITHQRWKEINENVIINLDLAMTNTIFSIIAKKYYYKDDLTHSHQIIQS